jgi:hypothetical protein
MAAFTTARHLSYPESRQPSSQSHPTTKSVYLLPSRKTYSTSTTRSSVERTTVSKNWIKQLHTLPVLHFNRCLITEYSETAAHFNGKFDTDNQIYAP